MSSSVSEPAEEGYVRKNNLDDTCIGFAELTIHPFFVLRLAGLPADVVDQLGDGAAIRHLEYIDRLGVRGQPLANVVADAIGAAYPKVAAQLGAKAARSVLQLKRDLFNLRESQDGAGAAVATFLAPSDLGALRDLQGLVSELAAAQRSWAQVHSNELSVGRSRFSHLFRLENLNAALQISNPPLFRRLCRYFDMPQGKHKPKEAEGYRNSLLNYIIRASQKISPLSSLGIAVAGKLVDGGPALQAGFVFGSATVSSDIHLRTAPFQGLLRELLRDPQRLSPEAPLRLNQTLRRDGDTLQWTKIVDDDSPMDRISGARHGMARMLSNKATELLISVFGALPPGRATVVLVTDSLRAHLPERLWPSIGGILRNAMQHGLVDFAGEPGAQCDAEAWLQAIRPFVRDESAERQLDQALMTLETCLARIRAAGRRELVDHVDDIDAAFDELAAAAGSSIRAADARPLVYEDCGLAAQTIDLSPQAMAPIHKDVGRLLAAVSFLGHPRFYGAAGRFISARFIERFGKDGRCTDIEPFLTEVACDFTGAGDASAVKGVAEDAIQAVADSFFTRLLAGMQDNDQYEIPAELLSEHVARLPAAIRARSVSHCINGQFVGRPGQGQGLVINQVYPGNSRMLSRFLPSGLAARDAVTRYLRRISYSGRYVNIPGVFGFTGNRHPDFSEAELRIPPFSCDRDNVGNIALSDCELGYDSQTEQVCLRGPDGQPVDAYFLGPQMTFRLPQVHQMLDALRNTADGLPPLWRSVAQRMPGFGQRAIQVPRLTMGTLTLARRTLCVPREQVPAADCDEAEFFERMQRWRNALRLPREVFYHQEDMRFSGLRSLGPKENVDMVALTALRKRTKPTYLDFSNPLMVALLRRNRVLQNFDLVLSEALPARSDILASIGASGHVSEISFEATLQPAEQYACT